MFCKQVTYLIGPSNSGKTYYFLKNYPNGKIVSCVPKESLGIDLNDKNYLDLNTLSKLTVDGQTQLFEEFSCKHLLVDEIHFFDYSKIILLYNLKVDYLFISFLTGSWTSEPFLFDSYITVWRREFAAISQFFIEMTCNLNHLFC